MGKGANKIDLTGEVAVVTGGSGGLGLSIAQRLANSGAKVAIWGIDEADLRAAAKTCTELNYQVVDVTDYASILTGLEQVEALGGPVSVLVNSAGITGPSQALVDYDIDMWSQVIEVNLIGTFLVNRAIVPGMKRQNYGRIVNIASVAGKEGNPNASAYSASKAGVIGLTKSLGKELAKFDIGVNAVAPAVANTKLLEQVSEEFIQYMLDKIPKGRFLEAEELSAMVAWLVSRENSFTTGAVFDISGGRATY